MKVRNCPFRLPGNKRYSGSDNHRTPRRRKNWQRGKMIPGERRLLDDLQRKKSLEK